MPLPKGRTNNPKGKPKGIKSAKTKAWEKLGEVIVNDSAERFMNILSEMKDEEFVKNYLMILEYFKPKQSRAEVKAEHSLTVNWEESKNYTPDENSSMT